MEGEMKKWYHFSILVFHYSKKKVAFRQPFFLNPKFLIFDLDTFNFVSWLDLINNIDPIENFSKTGMITIQMLSILAVVADKKLGATGISSRMGHA